MSGPGHAKVTPRSYRGGGPPVTGPGPGSAHNAQGEYIVMVSRVVGPRSIMKQRGL